MHVMPLERTWRYRRMPRRAIRKTAVVFAIVAACGASASAQPAATTAAEAEAAIAASAPPTAPPSHPELLAPPIAVTPQEGMRLVPERPAEPPLVVPPGTRASDAAVAQPMAPSRGGSRAGVMPEAQVRPGTLSAKPVDRAPGARMAPQSRAADAVGGGGNQLAPPQSERMPAAGVAPPQSVRMPEAGAGTALMQVDLSGRSQTELRISPAEMAGISPDAVRVAPPPPDAASFRESFESRYPVTEILLNINGSADFSPGRFILRGDLTPAAAADPAVVAAGPRAIAEAFIMEEVANFGIVDLADLQEVDMETGPSGWSNATYHRLVGGLRLDHSVIQLLIDPAGRVTTVQGVLPLVPDALYDAVRQPVLTRDEVLAIASHELAAARRDPNLAKHPRLSAISDPPYVVWTVSSSVILVIDAATGEVLERREGRIQ